jgi:hypothetical protein
MSQRDSGYERKERDLYETPEWVTEALLPHLRPILSVWEPACGSGKMTRVLARVAGVVATDIATGDDFLEAEKRADCIITNPPYELATQFIERALSLTADSGLVAMLLRTDFAHAKTRQHLFQHPAFAKKIELTKRIRWIEGSKGAPSFNHAWFVWDWQNLGKPTLAHSP